jgi:hypothetical protein
VIRRVILAHDGTPVRLLFEEAFMLIMFRSDATGAIEWLWNTRDGVAPTFADGATPAELLAIADPDEWAFVPNFVPPVGMRVIVDGASGRSGTSAAVKTVDAVMHRAFAERALRQPYRLPESEGGRG